jgi:hypothetical protein
MTKHNTFHISKIILIGAVLLLSACAALFRYHGVVTASGPIMNTVDRSLIEPPGELGQLVIDRHAQAPSDEISPKILVDGQEISEGDNIARCYNGGVILINLPAGRYEISMWSSSKTLRKKTVKITRKKRTHIWCGFEVGLGGPILGAFRTYYDRENEQEFFEKIFESELLRLTGIYELN